MAKDSILRLRSSIIYNQLLKREVEDGYNNKLSTKVEEIVDVVSNLLERISENMPEYTLHDPNHSAKIVEIIGKFLPVTTLEYLNSIELSLIILSAYLHDIGMTASREEKENIIANNVDYRILFKSLPEKKDKYDFYTAGNNIRMAAFVEDQVFTEYLRRNHVIRSADYIKKNLSCGKFEVEIDGIPFWKHLTTICNGHGVPVKTITDTVAYPNNTLVGDKIINVQFLSLLLRLGDILDLDPERTPKIIYDFVNPEDPISILEWKKHRSIIGFSISAERILFEAECSLPEVERALKQFMGWIEIERKQTMHLLGSYNQLPLNNYTLLLHSEVTSERIRSDGNYVYNDLKFEIDYQRVLDLLMGQRLYRSASFSLRELLQNSNDAIKARKEVYSDREDFFEPKISLAITSSTITINDNGIGMDLDTFRKYFLQIGRSYYSSPEFYSRYKEIDVTSEFGIGVLSVFMIANSITIESRKEPDDPINPPKPIHFEIPTAHSYTIQRVSKRFDVGTTILLKLKSEKPFKNISIKDILSELTPNPLFPIRISDNGVETLFEGKNIEEIATLPNYNDIIDYQDYRLDNFDEGRNNAFTHSFFAIDFTRSTNKKLKDIKGKLYLVNSNYYNWESCVNGHFCQRNFSIGSVRESDHFAIITTDNIDRLFPNWLTYYSTLNFTGNACLSVTPDRTDIIVDDRYEAMKSLIEEFIISELKDFFNSYVEKNGRENSFAYIDFLLASGFISFDNRHRKNSVSKSSLDFLVQHIYLPIINNSGEKERMSIKEIMKRDSISYINRAVNTQQIHSMLDLIGRTDHVLISLADLNHHVPLHHLEGFFYIVIAGRNIEYGWGEHTILTNMMPALKIHVIKFKGQFRNALYHTFCQNVQEYIDSAQQILCVPRQSMDLYMTLSASHRIMKNMVEIDGNLKKNSLKLLNKLQHLLAKNIEESLRRIGMDEKLFFEKNFAQYDDNYYAMLENIIGRDPFFLDNVNLSLAGLLISVVEAGFAENSDKDTWKLTASDFPKYWSNG